jgi:MoaA/NifB/PqqE/SkfB family radical SAM enzyme
MGSRLERGLAMPYEKASTTMDHCRRLGAEYLTFVGGEPTLHPDLPRLVERANELGYRKVMIDSNGLSIKHLLNVDPKGLYYVRISLDGATAATHEKVRGPETYEKAIASVRDLVRLGYSVRITYTVFTFNSHELPAMLSLAQSLGVTLVNLHSFSEEGLGRAHPDWSLTPEQWIDFCAQFETLKRKFDIPVRYPPTWVRPENLTEYTERGFRGCLGCSVDRLSIFPDGRCYICSLLFDTALNFGLMTENGFILNRGLNEYELFTKAAIGAPEPALMGCPAEAYLDAVPHKDFVSVCRLWRTPA